MILKQIFFSYFKKKYSSCNKQLHKKFSMIINFNVNVLMYGVKMIRGVKVISRAKDTRKNLSFPPIYFNPYFDVHKKQNKKQKIKRNITPHNENLCNNTHFTSLDMKMRVRFLCYTNKIFLKQIETLILARVKTKEFRQCYYFSFNYCCSCYNVF